MTDGLMSRVSILCQTSVLPRLQLKCSIEQFQGLCHFATFRPVDILAKPADYQRDRAFSNRCAAGLRLLPARARERGHPAAAMKAVTKTGKRGCGGCAHPD